MGFVSDITRKIAFWNYERTSWQWDVLCVLILVFIFLTPKSWFANTSYQQRTTIAVDVVGNHLERAEIERRARKKVNLPNGQLVSAPQEVKDLSGKVVAYEVDIR